MLKTQIRTERRSLRFWKNIPVRAAGKNADGKNFSEETETMVVNAHGGLLSLHQPLKVRAEITLTNLATQEEQACRVVTLRDPSGKGTHVGFEFLLPSPGFWGFDFPPDEWPAA